MAKMYWKMTVCLLTESIPNSHVTPSSGLSTAMFHAVALHNTGLYTAISHAESRTITLARIILLTCTVVHCTYANFFVQFQLK